LVQEALGTLAEQEAADRIGIWIAPGRAVSRQDSILTTFHSLVWDRAQHDTPSEWRILSLEPPLPDDLLLGRKAVAQELAGIPANLLIGPQVGLRHAMWIPVTSREQIRGLILLGSKGREAPERHRADSIAAELALALELEEQGDRARRRNADLTHAKRVLETSSIQHSADALLSRLAAECVGDAAGPGAAFAAIGVLPAPAGNSTQPVSLAFRWHSGDESWVRAVEGEPLAKVWRRALEVRQVIGSEPPSALSSSPVARILAFPLAVRGELLGALVVGLPLAAASLATLDRLELRALLVASALEHKVRMEEEAGRTRSEQALLDLFAEPVLLFNEAGRITAASQGARELLRSNGHVRDSQSSGILSFEHFSDLFCGRDRERVQRWLQESLRPASPGALSQPDRPQAQLHNGINVRLQLTPHAVGQHAAVLLQPFGAQTHAPQGEPAEAELQNVIEWLEEGVVLFDSHENVRAMNTRFAQIMGLPPGESEKPDSLDELIARLAPHSAEPGHFAARWRELARGIEGGMREELHMTRPAPRIVERASRPVLDSIGRQLGRVEIYRDLTAQRVFQSKLLQTEKLAALGQMVSGIAHELSNPLTSILGYAQRLLVRQDAPARIEEVRQIYQEAERAAAILRQVLLNARETLPERRLLSLNQVIMRAMELQRFSLATEKIRVEIDLDPALPFVHGDPGQLQQVVMNLVGNARQALEQQGQGGWIRMRTRRADERRVLFEVEDNGPGIPQTIQARIFDPFFTTKPAGVGTGLGLSIVLSVVREHGGQVRLLSPPQGGTTFQVEIPAASERQQEESRSLAALDRKTVPLPPAALSVAAPRPAPEFEPLRLARVLVVEDEPTVARLIADVLEDEGMQVEVLFDGREALQRAAGESYASRVRVASVSSVAAARRILEENAPAVIFLESELLAAESDGPRGMAPSLEAVVASLAIHAPVVVLGAADKREELAGLIAAGAADFVERKANFFAEARGVIHRRLQLAQQGAVSAVETFAEGEGDFGEVLRHELNNPLTGILGNAELLLAEIHRKNDGKIPRGGEQRLETIASLAVRLRETVRRLSQEWEERHHPVP
jgi:signal transduction histidine kinase